MLKFAVSGYPNKHTSFMEEYASRKRKATAPQSVSNDPITGVEPMISNSNDTPDDAKPLGCGASFSMKDMEKRLDASRDSFFDLDDVETILPKEMWNRHDRLRKNMTVRIRRPRIQSDTYGLSFKRCDTGMNMVSGVYRHHSVSSPRISSASELTKPEKLCETSNIRNHLRNSCNDLDQPQNAVDSMIDSCKVLAISNEPFPKRPRLDSSDKSYSPETDESQSDSQHLLRDSCMVNTQEKPKKLSHLKQLCNKLFGKKKNNRTIPNFHNKFSDVSSQIPDCTTWKLKPNRDVIFHVLKEDYRKTFVC